MELINIKKYFNLGLSLLLMTVLSGCGVANLMRVKYANDDNNPSWQGTENQKVIAVTFIGDKPYIKATVNQQEELLFLIDTGASFTILNDSEKVKRLSLSEGYELMVGGWGDDEHSRAYQSTLSSIEFAGITYKDFNVAYVPLSKSSYFLDEKEIIYDGVIGHDVLRHFSWTIDRENQKITLSNKPYVKQQGETELEFGTFWRKLSIPIEVDFGQGQRVQHDAIIDTGSRHYLKLSSKFAEELGKPVGKSIEAVDFGMSGMAKHRRISVPELRLGDNSYLQVKTNLIKSDDEDDWWIIGNSLLSKSVYTLDYFNNRLYLAPNSKEQITSRYNLLGLELRKQTDGTFIVRYVFPNLPASKTNIKVGTIITSLDEQQASQISENNWLDLTNTVGVHKLCSAVTGDGSQCWSIEAMPIAGYSTPAS